MIINFVGIGDPTKVQKLGNAIFNITEKYDNMALDYIKKNTKTKYIFLSSGAVYGGNYQEPVDENTDAKVVINNLFRRYNHISYKVDIPEFLMMQYIVNNQIKNKIIIGLVEDKVATIPASAF